MLLGGKPEGPGQEDDEECHRNGANQEGSQNVVFELSLDLVPRVYGLRAENPPMPFASVSNKVETDSEHGGT